jgi:hypothetical protein
MVKFWTLSLLSSLCGSSVLAQPPQDGAPASTAVFKANLPPSAGDTFFQVKHLLSSFEFWLAAMILAFGSLVVVLEYRTLKRMPDTKPDEVLRLFAVTFIIVGTLLFVAAGFDSSQIAPAAGLFGTIAGYLLGKGSRDRNDQKVDSGSDTGTPVEGSAPKPAGGRE